MPGKVGLSNPSCPIPSVLLPLIDRQEATGFNKHNDASPYLYTNSFLGYVINTTLQQQQTAMVDTALPKIESNSSPSPVNNRVAIREKGHIQDKAEW